MDIVALTRQQVAWQVLGGLLADVPEEPVITAVRDDELLNDWPLISEKAAQGVSALRDSRLEDETAEQIEVDFRRLFRGPGHLLAPPWESVFTSQEHLVFEAATLEVRKAYRAYGWQAPRLNKEPDDHISLELEFVRELLRHVIEAAAHDEPARAEAILSDHQRFVADHLAVWVPLFTDAILAGAQTHFMRGVGLLLSDAVEQADSLAG